MAAGNYTDDERNLICLLENVNFDDEDDDQDSTYVSVMLRNAAPKPLDSRTLSMFLHHAAGRRTPMEPSFLIKTEIHVISHRLRGLFNHGFVARYTRFNHGLKLRAEINLPKNFFVCKGSFLVGLSTARQPHSVSSPGTRVAATERTIPEVRKAAASVAGAAPTPPGWDPQLIERNLEVGQAVASVALAAGALGWEARLLGPSLGFSALRRLMGLTSETDLENELPVAAIFVFPTPAPKQYRTLSTKAFKTRIMRLFDDDRFKRKGRLSHGEITQEGGHDIFPSFFSAEKTDGGDDEHVRLDRMRCRLIGPDSFQYGPRATMRRALNSRGGVAAADFDEHYTMPHGHLKQFLLRCFHSDDSMDASLRRAFFPSSVLPWLPRVNLYVFVNRVEGFGTGLYCFVRNHLHLQRQRGSFRCDTPYLWESETIPSLAAFYLRRPSAAPDQPQLKKSAFVVAMVAPYINVTKEKNVYMFKKQTWEAGFLGEVLAVEAQAQGLSASALELHGYNWQPTLGINTADGSIISIYAVGKHRASGINVADGTVTAVGEIQVHESGY